MKKRLISAIVSLIMTVSVLAPVSHAETGGSSSSSGGHASSGGGAIASGNFSDETDNTGKFYYTLDGENVNVSLNGTVDFAETTEKNIIIACYDNDILIKTAVIALGSAVNGAAVNDFTITLAEEPKDLTVKAFAWSGFDKCTPLCDAAQLSDIPANAFKVYGCVTKTSKTDSLDNGDVEFLIEESGNFDGMIIGEADEADESTLDVIMNIGNTDIDRHLFEYVEAYVIKDVDDEFSILKYTPIADQTVTLSKDDINFENSTTEKLVSADGKEYVLNTDDIVYYVNGAEYYMNEGMLSFIQDIPEKYSKITLLDISPMRETEGDSTYDYIFIDRYYEAAVDSVIHKSEEISVLFDGEFVSSKMVIYTDDNDYQYSFKNEKNELCNISQLDDYEDKKIYIAYDMEAGFSLSSFYDVILEGAKATTAPQITHENRLSGAESTVVLRYSDEDNTAMLDGTLTFDCNGNMPYSMTVNFIKDNEIISSEKVKSNTAVKKLVFGYEEGTGEDYTIETKEFSLEKKPDKAVISFEDAEIADITVPVVSADAYKVYGRVTATPRTNQDLDNGKVTFMVEKADSFDGKWIDIDRNADELEYTGDMYYAGRDTSDLLLTYSQAYIHKNANDDYIIEAILPLTVGKTVELKAEDFDEAKSNNGSLYFYPSDEARNSVKYAINDEFYVYVNGVPYDELTSDYDKLTQFIASLPQATLTLQKLALMGSTITSSDYNLIRISVYGTAVVEQVTENEITFASSSSDINASGLDLSDDLTAYTFMLDGEEISAADLKENDILSIAYDIEDLFRHSEFYDVIVSRDTVSGKITSADYDREEYTIDNNVYRFADGMSEHLYVLTEYIFYLDAFGRIAMAEEEEIPKKLAVFKNLYKKAGSDWYAQLITTEGEKEYRVDDRDVEAYGKLLNPSFDGYSDAVVYYGTDKAEKYAQQVIEYAVSVSTNKLTIKNYDDEYNPTLVEGISSTAEYKKSVSKIGNVSIGADTVILDLSNDSIRTITKEELADEYEYTAYGYNKTVKGDQYYRFVILTSAPATAIASMSYYEDGTVWLYTEDDFLELTLDNDELLELLQKTRTDKKAAYVIHDCEKVLDAELIDAKKITGVYQNGYIGEYQVPKHISCHYPEFGVEGGVYTSLIEGESYDVLTYKKGSSSLSVIYGEIDESRDMFVGILSAAYDSYAVITDTDGNTARYTIPSRLESVFQNIETPVGICYDYYDDETLTRAEILEQTGSDITEVYHNGKIGSYTVPEYVYYYDYDSYTTYKIPSSALVEDEEYTVLQYAKDSYAIEIIDGGALTKDEELKYGILKNLYKKAGGNWYAQIINTDGSEEEYPIDYSRAETYKSLLNVTDSYGIDYSYGDKLEKYPSQAIEYSVSAVGKLYLKSDALLDGTVANDMEYMQSSSKIGAIKIDDDTVILDVSGADDDKIIQITKSQLIDGVTYTAYGYDRATSGERCYRFVLITDGVNTYSSANQLAVFESFAFAEDEGDEYTALNLVVDGEHRQFLVDEDAWGYENLQDGDPILFMTDYDGKITDIKEVFSENGLLSDSYQTFMYKVLDNPKGIPSDVNWNNLLTGDIDVVFGVITQKRGGNIEFAELKDSAEIVNDSEQGIWISLDNYSWNLEFSEAKIYTYDFNSNPRKSRIYTDYELYKTYFSNKSVYEDTAGGRWLNIADYDVIDNVVFAVARVDDDKVCEIYQIINGD